jgi:phosphoenolpyruvate carboxykinase (ATP)
MPLPPHIYADMLGEKIGRHQTRCYLINTGWTGGPYGTGHRIDLGTTRAIVDAVLDGSIEESEFTHNELFNLDVPLTCPGVESQILDPKLTWVDEDAYDETAVKLARMFVDNFDKRFSDVNDEIREAGPRLP